MIDGCQVFVKREDLLPFPFGGNKYRIALEFFSDMEGKVKNAIIGYGSPSSNLCRVIANIACARNIPCFIVSPGKPGEQAQTYNSEITQLCKASIVKCSTDNIFDKIESAIFNCQSNGLNPYYIIGNKYSLWQKLCELSEYIFPGVHRMTDLLLDCKGSQFRSSPSNLCSKSLYLSILQTSPQIFSGH